MKVSNPVFNDLFPFLIEKYPISINNRIHINPNTPSSKNVDRNRFVGCGTL